MELEGGGRGGGEEHRREMVYIRYLHNTAHDSPRTRAPFVTGDTVH